MLYNVKKRGKQMIDLHMHTINSDGSDTVEDLLRKCQELNLEFISITDHDTCKSYDDLKSIDVAKIYKGKIIPGCEFTTIYKGRTVEILGYGINTDDINKWKNEFYTEQKIKERIDYCKKEVIEKLSKLGIHIDIDTLDTDCSYDRAIYRKLIINKVENEKILGKGMLDNLRFLFRNGISNPSSQIFVDVSKYRPTPKQITDLIHKSGGKAFLAHPYQYSFNNILEMITNLRKECELDGVEAFHSSFTLEQMMEIQEYAKKNNLFICGGSDYHGTNKPEIKLKIGSDNLHISKNILEWYKD